MGALFSSEEKQEQERKEKELREQKIRQEEEAWQARVREAQLERIREQEADRRLRLARQRTQEEANRRYEAELRAHKEQMRRYRIQPMIVIPSLYQNQLYELNSLESTSAKYHELCRMFRSTGKPYMRVISIKSINNPLQKAAYTLKKNEAIQIYKKGTNIERYLYHGTTEQNLDSICKTNLDRRRTTHHKYGHGVSFTPFSYYASHYCDKGNCEKIILVCKVITINWQIGNAYTTVPEDTCDYTQNTPKGDVVVKYDDDTYYPEYIIKFRMDQTDSDNLVTMMRGISVYDN